jgi:hypothetical protein
MRNLSTIFLLLYVGICLGQNENANYDVAQRNMRLIQSSPVNQIANEQLEAFTRQYTSQHMGAGAARSGPAYIIPVVFHIIHDGGTEMLSDSTVRIEVSRMNQYMSASNPGISYVAPAFDTLVGNAQIEFRLAQKDPQGNCTNGIERIYTQATYFGDDYTKIHDWPNDKYLNIWVTKETWYNVYGYAYYPSAVAATPVIDGIMVMSETVGTFTSYYYPTVTHFTGHWMNLLNLIQDFNNPCADTVNDHVADTPPMSTYGNCNITQSICNPPVIENVQNIMGGTPQCEIMFTKGQVARMQATLNSSVSGRSNLNSAANLTATGTDVANPVSCAAPIADFTVNQRFACTGIPVRFGNASYNATVTSRTWTFPQDAAVTFANSDTPSASFTTPGWKQITLQVANANGSNQITKNMVYVTDGTEITAPFFDGFEDAVSAQANWQSINYDNNNTSFQYDPNIGHQSNSCYKLNDAAVTYQGDVDELLSPAFDLSQLDTTLCTLSFDYSFASADPTHADDSTAALGVYATNDCGATWARIYWQTGYGIFNAGTIASSYTPSATDEYWQGVSVKIPSAYRTINTNFKIQVVSGAGINNFYIDNINIGQSIAGIADMKSNIQSMDIVPNPAKDMATITVSSTTMSRITIKAYDIQGREVSTIYGGRIGIGASRIPFDTRVLSDGVYLIRISDGISTMQQRFVKM